MASPEEIQLLHALLRENDVPCPMCGYNLRNLQSECCPECGGGLKLQVGLTEPRLAAYISLLSACLLGLGGSSLFSMVALAAAPRSWWGKPPGLILLSLLIVTAGLLPIILVNRTRFRRSSSGRQTGLAFGMWCLVTVLSIAFVILFKDH